MSVQIFLPDGIIEMDNLSTNMFQHERGCSLAHSTHNLIYETDRLTNIRPMSYAKC